MTLFALFLILTMACVGGLTWTTFTLYFRHHTMYASEFAIGCMVSFAFGAMAIFCGTMTFSELYQ